MISSRWFRYSAFVAAVVAALCVSGARVRAQDKDISGAWTFTIQGDSAPVTAQITFKVESGRLSGHVASSMSGEQDFIGTLNGAEIEFGFGGDAGQIVFKGTVESTAAMKGTFDNPGGGSSGTFTAKRKE